MDQLSEFLCLITDVVKIQGDGFLNRNLQQDVGIVTFQVVKEHPYLQQREEDIP